MANVVIDGVEYAPVSNGGEARIAVLQRGWILVGRYLRDGDNCQLSNAFVIRTWGTSAGLGELAEGGPKTATKLDKCNGLVEFHRLTEVLAITCKEASWQATLK